MAIQELDSRRRPDCTKTYPRGTKAALLKDGAFAFGEKDAELFCYSLAGSAENLTGPMDLHRTCTGFSSHRTF